MSVPSTESKFNILTLQGELWAQLFGEVFNNFAFLCKLGGDPWPSKRA